MCDTHWSIFKNVRIVNLWVQHMCASHLIWKNIDTFMWNEMVLVRNFIFHFPDDQIGNVLKSTVFRTNSAPIFRPFETVLLEPMQFLVAIPSMFIDIDFMYPSHWNCVQQRLVQCDMMTYACFWSHTSSLENYFIVTLLPGYLMIRTIYFGSHKVNVKRINCLRILTC